MRNKSNPLTTVAAPPQTFDTFIFSEFTSSGKRHPFFTAKHVGRSR
jgi:hypothetical protein